MYGIPRENLFIRKIIMMESERKRRIEILIEKLKERNIYLYGAGIRGKVALENLNILGYEKNICGFIDDNGQKEWVQGKRVWRTDDIESLAIPNASFIITTYAVEKMACSLMEKGVSAENIHFFPELLIDDVAIETFRTNREKIEQVYNILSDNLSKYIYKSLFDIYINGNIGILSRTKGDCQYFPNEGINDEIEEFRLSEKEGFVDCGAYDGDTIRSFKIRTNDKFKKIWAFEPDADNFVRLVDYVEKEQDKRIEVINGGVYSQNTDMFFRGNCSTTSALAQTGEEKVRVYQLDSIIDEPVTYIKMDIEGSEKEALSGAKRIIAEYKPKLAICIYHKIEDFWEIPLLIKMLNPDYKIYIRNYEDRIDETICYAV